MNILICDDMQAESDKLTELFDDSGLEINTVVFNNVNDALDYIRSGAVIDVCFFDIIMPEMSGVALAKQLRADSFNGQIVFLSTSHEYGPETYTVKAFSYLLKPPTLDSVREVLQGLDEARKNVDTDGILVRNSSGLRFVLFREISHIEVINHNVYFRLTNGSELETRTTFAEAAQQLLSDKRFIQCHRSYIVNMSAVTNLRGSDFIMRGGVVISISKSYPEAKGQYLKWALGRDRR